MRRLTDLFAQLPGNTKIVKVRNIQLNLARIFFAITSVSAICGVLLELYIAYNLDKIFPTASLTSAPSAHGWTAINYQLFYFTTQSNLLIAITTLILAIKPSCQSRVFQVFRLAAMIDIAITGIVFNLLLSGTTGLPAIVEVSQFVQHTINPLLAWLGWIAFGPREIFSWKKICCSSVIPLSYLIVTFIRGKYLNWYPYIFLDVTALGYAKVLIFSVGIIILYFLCAALLAVLNKILRKDKNFIKTHPSRPQRHE
ncbi:Pr6Pr family membrane protein [Bacillus thuringiensis]|nr:Pr6Pr family membrane protein [Bacillus thuringiensis]MED3632980.1 Pr6Pr family membrane protein [Bacillus thuringiensis]